METKTVLSNFIWRFMERCGAQGVSLIVSILLARLLAPEIYGKISLIMVFITILNVFIDSGLGTALIQKAEVDDLDYSSVFYFNLTVCILLYIVMFIAAPFISKFYNDMSLVPIIRVISILLIISGVKNIQQAYVSRNMLFKKFFLSTLGGTIISAFLGLIMAYKGYGVWALVIQQLSNAIVDTLILWIVVKWRPKLIFSFSRLKTLLSYGWKLLFSAILETVYNNMRSLIIGKMYSSSDLAYYNQGEKFPNLIIMNINTSIDSVLLPTMSNVQNDKNRIKSMTRRAIKTSTYIIAPLMMGLAFCSQSIVTLLLGEKWLPCVPFLCVFCITYMFFPIHTANLNAIKAMGRSDLFLKLEIRKKLVGIVILFSTMYFGVMAMAYGLLLGSLISQIINSSPNKKLLNYGYLEQLMDVFPAIFLAIIMGVVVYFIGLLPINNIILLPVQIIAGAFIYVVVSVVFHLESFEFIVNNLMKMINK